MKDKYIGNTKKKVVHGSAVRSWAALIVCLLIGTSAGSRPALRLDRQEHLVSHLLERGRASWEPGSGRSGGNALRIITSQGAEPIRFRLFDTPRWLPGRDRPRAHAWLKAVRGECRLDFVGYDPQSKKERFRHKIVETKGSPNWRYGACDILLDEDIGRFLFNIEVTAYGDEILVDGLEVHTLASVLANGDFRKFELPPPARADESPPEQTAWGWRRVYSADSTHSRAQADLVALQEPTGNILQVEKEEGELILSAEPLGRLDGIGELVARVRVGIDSSLIPEVRLRQYGSKGLLREDVSVRQSELTEEVEDILITTERVPQQSQTLRMELRLCFPNVAGTCRVRIAELCPFPSDDEKIELYVDQVGYNCDEPLRFVVASSRFPSGGGGTFVLTKRDGERETGTLAARGRTVGQNEIDWGRYYFEGVVPQPRAGTYRLEVRLGDRTVSADPVEVGAGLRSLKTGRFAHRFYYYQRCGYVVPGWHDLCHMDDGRLPNGERVDVTGGYHNAGDFHKHLGDNTPVSVYGMVSAYGSLKHFLAASEPADDGCPGILDEAFWGADWLRKMVDPRTGRIWMNVTNDIDYYGIPENDTDGIPGTGDDRLVGTVDLADRGSFAIAAWAALYRHTGERQYLDSAEGVWAAYEEDIVEGCNPRHIFAAIELRRATGQERYRVAADVLARRLLNLQNREGWFAVVPDGGPVLRLVDEGTIPAALAEFVLTFPESLVRDRIREALQRYFSWSFRMADNPFGITRAYTGGEPFFFLNRGAWYGGLNSQYCSVAWAAYLASRLFADEPEFSTQLRAHAANQIHWVLGMNPLGLCMMEGLGNSHRIYFHHLYAEIPGHPRGAVPGAIPNGIVRPPGNTDRPWFDLRTGAGSLPGAESAEPWLPHNAYYLLMLSASERASLDEQR